MTSQIVVTRINKVCTLNCPLLFYVQGSMQVYLCCYCFFGFYVVVLDVFYYIVFKCSTVGQAFIMKIVA